MKFSNLKQLVAALTPYVPFTVCGTALFILNVWLIREQFAVEYSAHLLSNEGSFISISRVMLDHPSENSWWPMWNAGIPFNHTYTLGLPWLVAIFSRLSGHSPALAYHVVTGLFYCAGPATLFIMASILSKRILASFLCSIAFSLISPAAILIPAIRNDAGGLWNPQRIKALVHYGAGPQVTAVSLLPLALLLLHLALSRRGLLLSVLAGTAMAAVVLTNAFGAVSLAIATACLLVAAPCRQWPKNLFCTICISAVSYLAVCSWLPPSLLKTVRLNSQTVGGDFRWSVKSMIAIMIVVAMSICVRSALSVSSNTYLKFSVLFASTMGSIAILASTFRLFALPQGDRYYMEMELAFCCALVVPVAYVLRHLNRLKRWGVVSIIVIAMGWQALRFTSVAKELIKSVDIQETSEHRTSVALAKLFSNQRVMVAGSPSFWFNIFTDTPQLFGGHEPFNPNWINRVALFTINNGGIAGSRDAEICILWLKAFGVHGINVPGRDSKEHYKPFQRNFELFDGTLKPVYKQYGDTIYRVPQRNPGLAHVIPRTAVVERRPYDGLDVEQVRRYVAALDDDSVPVASYFQPNFHSAVIGAKLNAGQVVSVQTSYHPGWTATIGGERRRILSDGLGLLLIEPACIGACEIRLSFDGGVEARITQWLSRLTLGVIVLNLLFVAIRRVAYFKDG